MLSKADEEQLQRVCGNDETLAEARRLIPVARTRTNQGSGHYLSGLTTALPAICAYIASKQLNNNDVDLDNARQSSCLKTADFKKALRTVATVLEAESSPKKKRNEATHDVLHEKYSVEMPFSVLSVFLQQAEHALIQLDTRNKIDSLDVRCAVFFWTCSIVKAKQLPTLDEFAQDNALLSRRLIPIIKLLDDKCKSLKSKLVEAAKNTSRPSSPTKSMLQATPRTPRRSPTKPLRELPTRESVKKQRQDQSTGAIPSRGPDSIDEDMEPPETPTKKRKLDELTPTPSLTKRRLPFPPVTPSAPHITHLTSPTKAKPNATPAISSPLRRSARSVLQQEVDTAMDVDEDEDVGDNINRSLELDLSKFVLAEDDIEKMEEPAVTRRFRPVYQDSRQWYARDAKVLRSWREASGFAGI
ncbi:hypothetical protein P691DRAFT_704443 [Macrolepiota fuliginosa MF-IS2]|uniref:Uncharacterized protein n=1 Tax=Macrolepiota fuliginosa MF-IS2 TaxID=1400762 RepID=A0A9P6C2B6_9AGAR|nr:hypothetical protein P691DRAFT_704443 [Macrolepiota fuliginosa MF-IS2]